MVYSLEAFCASQEAVLEEDWTGLPESTRTFLSKLDLSAFHPFCNTTHADAIPSIQDIPPVGPLGSYDHENAWEALVTVLYLHLPPLLAFADTWFRLVGAGIVAPLGFLYLCRYHYNYYHYHYYEIAEKPIEKSSWLSIIIAVTTICSLPVMTDSMYVMEFGCYYGIFLFVGSILLGARICQGRQLRKTRALLILLLLLAFHLTWDWQTYQFHFGETDEVNLSIAPGLYYSQHNALVNKTVSLWPERLRTYTREFGATPWIHTGDARTGLPYFFNQRVPATKFLRVHLPVEDGEVLILGIAFPETGHDPTKPVYMILHGVNGGTSEDYLQDLAWRRTRANSTVAVMISRGLQDAPLRGWNMFHGARWSDAHESAKALRRAMEPGQILAGVGYSMGAIVLNNYVASSGPDCALDAAFSVSGALECRYEMNFRRPKHLWQPMIVGYLRADQHIAKWGERMKARLNHSDLVGMLRATDVVELDKYIVVAYNGFDNLTHFYSKMGALGDVAVEDLQRLPSEVPNAKIHNVSIPLCVLHAFDDPISTWRTNAANKGFMQPDNLVESGSGNLILMLTQTGGHVGWPLGWFPFGRSWEFMSEAIGSFVDAVALAKQA